MNRIIFTDPHIEEKALDELENIFKEVFKQEVDELIMVGDYFHKKRPTAKEIIFGTKWAYFFRKRFKKVVFVRGNHDRTLDISAVDYLQYLGIEIVDDYKDEDGTYYGHFMVNESKYQYGTARCGIKDLEKHTFVILGHMHSYQKLSSNAIHLGSCRYVNFNESKDKSKFMMLNYNRLSWKLIEFQTPIPMKDVISTKELEKIHKDTKVRLIVSSYNQFKEEINEIAKWKDRFKEFKLHLDFGTNTEKKEEKIQQVEKKKLAEVLRQGIDNIEDEDVKKLLREVL